MKSQLRKQLIVISSFSLWLIAAVFFWFLSRTNETSIYAGFLAFTSEVGLDFVAALLTLHLWRKNTGQEKNVFALFSVSFFILMVSDVVFNVVVDVLGTTRFTNVVNFAIYVPFLGFLVLQTMIWAIIFLKAKPTKNKKIIFVSYLPIAITVLAIFVIFLLGRLIWKMQAFSFLGLYTTLDAVLQMLSFAFAVLCLSVAANKQIRYISVGYLVIVSCAFIVQLNTLAQALEPRAFIEPMWSLGVLLMVLGFYDILKNPHDLGTKKWLNSLSSVQAQCAFWGFIFCMSSVMIFWVISYIFVGEMLLKIHPLHYLPSILIVFSIFAVLISTIFAKTLSHPFKRVETIIDSYLSEKEPDALQPKCHYNIDEFDRLENFITKAFSVLKERNKAESFFVKHARQVAHDIRSPLIALESVADQLENNDDKARLLRKIATRITDIANSFLALARSKADSLPVNNQDFVSDNLIFPLVEKVVAEKRLQLDEVKCAIELVINANARFACVSLNASSFMRAISNVLSNSIEAVANQNGVVKVMLAVSDKTLLLEIRDNGCGIAAQNLERIFDDGFTHAKASGNGLGLFYTKQVITTANGAIKVSSELGKGTEVKINLPLSPLASWLADTCNICHRVCIVDDEEEVLGVVNKLLLDSKQKIAIEYFKQPEEFLACQERYVGSTVLIDNTFKNSALTGVQILSQITCKSNVYLVTNDYDSEGLIKQIQVIGGKMIPKPCLAYVKLVGL